MPKKHGKDVEIQIMDNDAATVQNISGDGNSVDLSVTVSADDVTAFGDSWMSRIAGLKDWSLDFSGYYNTSGSVAKICYDIEAGAGSTAACFGFAGSPASGSTPIYRSSKAIMSDVSIAGPHDGPVTVSFTLTGASALTRHVS